MQQRIKEFVKGPRFLGFVVAALTVWAAAASWVVIDLNDQVIAARAKATTARPASQSTKSLKRDKETVRVFGGMFAQGFRLSQADQCDAPFVKIFLLLQFEGEDMKKAFADGCVGEVNRVRKGTQQ